VYVANGGANGDSPGTVSVINAVACNGTITTGCHRRFPTVATGRFPVSLALDPRTGILYVTDLNNATVTILNGTRCNATVTSGCRKTPPEQAVGSEPLGVALNPRTRTVYVTDRLQPGSLSIFKTTQH